MATIRALAPLVFLAAVSSCYSWRSTTPEALTPERPRGTIRVTLLGGPAVLLEDALMVRDTLVGRHRTEPGRQGRRPVYGTVRVPRPDIGLLELHTFDTGKTIGRGGLLVLGLGGVLTMFLNGAFDSRSSP